MADILYWDFRTGCSNSAKFARFYLMGLKYWGYCGHIEIVKALIVSTRNGHTLFHEKNFIKNFTHYISLFCIQMALDKDTNGALE